MQHIDVSKTDTKFYFLEQQNVQANLNFSLKVLC